MEREAVVYKLYPELINDILDDIKYKFLIKHSSINGRVHIKYSIIDRKEHVYYNSHVFHLGICLYDPVTTNVVSEFFTIFLQFYKDKILLINDKEKIEISDIHEIGNNILCMIYI
jgi:hypothetical protein